MRLALCHFAVVLLVIAAGKVQHSMQHQDLQLGCGTVAETSRIAQGDLGRNRNIAIGGINDSGSGPASSSCTSRNGDGWEGKHIRGAVFAAETAVQSAQLAAAGDQNSHSAPYTDGPLRTHHKAAQRGRANPRDRLAKYNQMLVVQSELQLPDYHSFDPRA